MNTVSLDSIIQAADNSQELSLVLDLLVRAGMHLKTYHVEDLGYGFDVAKHRQALAMLEFLAEMWQK